MGLWIMGVVASSPLTVTVGGIPTMYETTGVVGIPLAFLVVGAVLMVLAAAFSSASGHIRHAAPFYALLARGISPIVGVAGGVLALAVYLAFGSSLFGLASATLADLFHLHGAWWTTALALLVLVAVMGLLGGLSSARLLGGLLGLEIALIVFYVVAALVNRAADLSLTGFAPSSLMVPGMAGVLAFAVAASAGVETVLAYAEEARGGAKTMNAATLSAVGFAALFYALTAWAMGVHGSTTGVAVEGPLQTLHDVFGAAIGGLATLLLISSIFAAMTSFLHAGARYLFALAREGVLPRFLTRVSKRGDGGTPVAAALTQTTLTGLVIGGFALAGAEPLAMFSWLSTIGALALLVLLVVGGGAAYGFFAKGQGTNDSIVVRRIAPVTGCVLGTVLLIMMMGNLGSLLGLPTGSQRWLTVPIVVIGVSVTGLAWGGLVRWLRPASAAAIGRIVADPVTSPVTRLGKLAM
ncbi:amino acid permease [Rhizocola hellebori]|uniref:Amino acid permease n=1 Tax=Rhizocola hellebori TaxID=1392758 RepID=A0A8J3Q4N7_9ACTN|nr:amino acid permease [Rhizocola hellebori]